MLHVEWTSMVSSKGKLQQAEHRAFLSKFHAWGLEVRPCPRQELWLLNDLWLVLKSYLKW